MTNNFMAAVNIFKWFSNKGFMLSLPCFPSRKLKSPGLPLPSMHNASKNSTKEEELRKVFTHFDSNGDGKISSQELGVYFTSIGESISPNMVQRVIDDFDKDGDNLLEFSDFVQLVEADNNVDDDLRRAFEMFEEEKGAGCISPRGLQQMFNRLGDVKSLEECVAMIRVFDLDGNGVLDFHEFQKMMT